MNISINSARLISPVAAPRRYPAVTGIVSSECNLHNRAARNPAGVADRTKHNVIRVCGYNRSRAQFRAATAGSGRKYLRHCV